MKMQAFNTNIHPIWDTMRFPFETPAISKLKSEICLWANSGITGGVVLGDGRTGKSISIGVIKEAIKLKTGARGIRSVLEQFFIDLTYNITDLKKKKVKEIYIDDLTHDNISYIYEVDKEEDN